MRSLLWFVSFVPLLAAVTSASADNQGTGAIEFAQEYTRLHKEGKPQEAITRHWDHGTLLSTIFRQDIDQYSAEERAELASKYTQVVLETLAHPRLRAELRKAEFSGFEQRVMSDTLTAVRFTMTLSNGKSTQNTLILQKQSEGWRVVNKGTGGKLLLAASLRREYIKTGLTPRQYVNELLTASAPVRWEDRWNK
jgi:hypothetical protein